MTAGDEGAVATAKGRLIAAASILGVLQADPAEWFSGVDEGLKAEVEAGNVTSDVYDVEQSDVIRLCDEGLIEPIDPAALPAAADGTPAADDYLPQALHDCATAIMVWSTVIAYDTSAFPNGAPATVADFFDTAQYPTATFVSRSVTVDADDANEATVVGGVPLSGATVMATDLRASASLVIAGLVAITPAAGTRAWAWRT